MLHVGQLAIPAEETGTSVLVLAEIRRGIELKRHSDPEQGKTLDRWFSQMRIGLGDRMLPVDESVADAWALLGIPDSRSLIDASWQRRPRCITSHLSTTGGATIGSIAGSSGVVTLPVGTLGAYRLLLVAALSQRCGTWPRRV